jgi:ribonuclease P protein component
LTKELKNFDRLKSENDIAAVYKKGKVIISLDKKLKASHISSERITHRIRVAITVSSKAGNSVWRNRLKRIIREAIRQEKVLLNEVVSSNKSEISIIFSPYRINQVSLKHIFLKDIKPAVTDILYKLSKKATNN